MAERRPIMGVPMERLRASGAILAAVVLLAGCVTGTGSPSPAGSTGPSAPSSNVPPTPTPTPTPDPTASPTPAPTPTPITGGTWQPAGTMTVERSDPVVLALADGRALVLGQPADPSTCTGCSNAELYDPATNTWRATARTGQPREGFVAVALADGRVLVTGGLTIPTGTKQPQSISSTVIYDPATESWTAAGLLDTARTGAIGTLLPDGRVLVAGGFFFRLSTGPQGLGPEGTLVAFDGGSGAGDAGTVPPTDVAPDPIGSAMATAEIFDPSTGRWTPTGPMKYARLGPAMTTLKDGRVLVVGSLGGPDNGVAVAAGALESAELYDPATKRFTLTGSLPPPDTAEIARLGLVAAGGFKPLGEDVGSVGTLIALDDGDALLIGAMRWWKHSAELSRSLRFEARTGRWVEVGQPYAKEGVGGGYDWPVTSTVSRTGAFVARLADGRVLVAGGDGAGMEGGGAMTASAEIYDPETGTWTKAPSMPTPRASVAYTSIGAAVTLADGSVLVVGGSLDDHTIAPPVRFVPSDG